MTPTQYKAAQNGRTEMTHYFTKDQAERLAKRDREWSVRKLQHSPFYMVWSDRSDHYVEFDSLDNELQLAKSVVRS